MSMQVRFLLALFFGVAVAYSAARAADNTRYVSIKGNNANPCTLTLPCRSLQKAIKVVPAGGEIQILDSGFYGNRATINKSLTINGNGHTVYLSAIVTIGDASAVVTLRRLTLDGQSAVATGIDITAAAAVHIERCVIHHFTQFGIHSTAAAAALFISDSVSRNNLNGLTVSGAPLVTIDNSRFENNSNNGASFSDGVAAIHRSTASDNGSNGFGSSGASVSIMSSVASYNGNEGFGAGGGTMTVDSSLAHGNFHGVEVFGGATARVSNSTVTGNTNGFINTGSTFESRGNNTVRGNTNNTSGTITAIGGV